MWNWGPENTLWQATHTNGHFTPFAVFDLPTARDWYGQQATTVGNVAQVAADAVAGRYYDWASQYNYENHLAAEYLMSSPNGNSVINRLGAAVLDVPLPGGETYSANQAVGSLFWDAAATPYKAAQLGLYAIDMGSSIRQGDWTGAAIQTAVQFGNPFRNWDGAVRQFDGTIGQINSLAANFDALPQLVRQAFQQGASASGQIAGDMALKTASKLYESTSDSVFTHSSPASNANVDVGGVLLDCKATCELGGMPIEGAYWDEKTNSLVMVTQGKRLLAGPMLDLDHLRVALRAAWSGEPLGVSIDPPGKYRYSRDALVPAGTPMYVSYLGNTRGTGFGAIMFEADRILKCLTKGVDNETGRPFNVDVPGYRTLIDRLCTDSGYRPGLWHRFWFVIDNVSLVLDPKSGVLKFDEVRIKLLNECELNGEPAEGLVATSDNDFVNHLTENYDLYAKHEPSLARLKELGCISALAQYLSQEGVSVDVASLFTKQPVAVETPDETPAIVASRSMGNQIISLSGGVKMDRVPTINKVQQPATKELRETCEAWRPGVVSRIWHVGEPENDRVAIAMPLGRPEKPHTESVTDDGLIEGFGLSRFYDSAYEFVGDFGPGWRLLVPFRITPIQASRLRPETRDPKQPTEEDRPNVLVLHDMESGWATRYRLSDGRAHDKVYQRMRSQVKRDGGVSFDPASGSTILIEQDGYRMRRRDKQYMFCADGLLRRVEHGDGQTVVYEWEGSTVSAVSDGNGQRYKIDRNESGLVVDIGCPGGGRLTYKYDVSGRLSSADCKGITRDDYRYDQSGHLVECRDEGGSVARRAVYDDVGNVCEKSDRIEAKNGSWLKRTFHDGRLASVADNLGWQIHYDYNQSGGVASVRLASPREDLVTLYYDEDGKLKRLADVSGDGLDVTYNEGAVDQLAHSNGGRLKMAMQDGRYRWHYEGIDGDRCEALFDVQGRPVRLTDADGRTARIKYDAKSFRVRSPEGHYRIKQGGKATQINARIRGHVLKASVSESASSASCSRGLLWQRRLSEMESCGEGTSLRDAAGEVQWKQSQDASMVNVNISWSDEIG